MATVAFDRDTHNLKQKHHIHAMLTASSNPVIHTDSIQWYMDAIKDYPQLTFEQEQTLARRYKQGDQEAYQHLVNCNLKLVVSVAKWYARGDRIPLLDLIQEGSIGLMHAIKKFEPERGFKLSTYATQWIKQYISRAIPEMERHIHVPCYVHEAIVKSRKHETVLTGELGREPTLQELATSTGFTVDELELHRFHDSMMLSLDEPFHEHHEDTSISDILEDPESDFSNWDSTVEDIQEKTHQALAKLSERERAIIQDRYGIGQGDKENYKHTLQELGVKHGITRERVRQVEEKALGKLTALLAPLEKELV